MVGWTRRVRVCKYIFTFQTKNDWKQITVTAMINEWHWNRRKRGRWWRWWRWWGWWEWWEWWWRMMENDNVLANKVMRDFWQTTVEMMRVERTKSDLQWDQNKWKWMQNFIISGETKIWFEIIDNFLDGHIWPLERFVEFDACRRTLMVRMNVQRRVWLGRAWTLAVDCRKRKHRLNRCLVKCFVLELEKLREKRDFR